VQVVRRGRDVDGERLQRLQEKVEAGLAVRAAHHAGAAQSAQELRRHLALARAAVERRDDRALDHHRAQRRRAER
jgi:hypothetical protein